MLVNKDLTQRVLGAAIEVHRALGPGLLESAYEECLCHELQLRRLTFDRQVDLPIAYKGIRLDCGYRLDIAVQNSVILELKSVEKLLPVHEAQLLTRSRTHAVAPKRMTLFYPILCVAGKNNNAYARTDRRPFSSGTPVRSR
jgi:GxxExxY protein